MTKIITIWQRQVRGEWEHNHIAEGYNETLKVPIGCDAQQTKSWASGKWKALKAELSETNVVTLCSE